MSGDSFKAALFGMVAEKALGAEQALALVARLKAADPTFHLDRSAADLLGGEAPAATTAGAEAVPAPIAVIGMAGRFGDCADLDAFGRMILDGRSCVRPLPAGRWPDADRSVQGGFLPAETVTGFEPGFFRLSPTEAALMDPQQRLFLETAWHAFEDAAYAEPALAGRRCGVFVGAGSGDYSQLLDQAGIAPSPLALMGNVTSILAARIAYHLDLKGPALAIDTACSSSLVAVHLASESLRRGECDLALAGGVCVINTGRFVAAMTEAGMLSPSGACHTFDSRADGFVCGEGAGAVVLKRLADALRDGDRIHGVILGSGINQDGRTNGITAPSAPAQAALERQIHERFRIDPARIGYVEAHGTGTPLGDPIEVEALTASFGPLPAGQVALGSAKTNLGHALTAAGIAGLLKLLLILRARTLPPAPDFRAPNPRLDLDRTPFRVPSRAEPWPLPAAGGPRLAAVSSFGFSGTNAHLVLAEAPTPPARPAETPRAMPLTLSARTASAMRAQAGVLAARLRDDQALRLDDVAYTLAHGRAQLEQQAVLVVHDRDEAIRALEALARGEAPASPVSLPPVPEGRRAGLPLYPFERVPCLPPGMAPAPAAATGATIDELQRGLLAEPAAAGFVAHGQSFARVQALGVKLAAASLLACLDRDVLSRAGLARRLGIAPERQRLWQALSDLLAASGFLRIEGDLLRLARDGLDPVVISAEAARLEADEPAMRPFLALLRATTTALPAVLRGEIAGTTVLFPEGRLDLVEPIYGQNPLAEHFNRLLARSVRALVEERLALAPSERVTILEVGAGTGGASGPVLEVLEGFGRRVHYLYTDVSLGFLQHGHGRFGERIETALLDVAAAPEPQGIATASQAIVLASNVLHATADLGATLGHLRRLLLPGGALVLNEVTAVQPFATLTFGLTDDWWGFRDDAHRLPGAPLCDVGRWRAVLAEAGFPDLRALGLPGEADETAMGQAVLIARRDQAQLAPVPTGPRKGWPQRLDAATAPAASAASSGDLELLLAEDLAEVLGQKPGAIDPRGRFMDYGVDSILGVGFVSRINRRLDLDLPPTIVFTYPTIRDLARHLRADLKIASPARAVESPPARAAADEPIAVIGMSAHFADADGLDAFHAMLAEGRSGVGDIGARFGIDPDDPPEHLRAAAPYLRHAGALPRIDLFDPMFFKISGREAELTDPQHRVFLIEAWRTLEHAGYGAAGLDGALCGVFVGCHGGDYTHRMAELGVVPDSHAFMGNAASILAARIAYILNLKGPALAVDTACSSSLVAVHLACQAIRAGECAMALAGGVFLNTTLGFNVAAASAGMLSPRGRCATFDAEADGFVPGEGAGAVLLKPLGRAIANGDRIIAVIQGSAVNQDGRTSGITAPNPISQAEVIRTALDRAGIAPAEVSYVETHGTGTRLGDPIEIEGLTRVFGQGHALRLGSVKTNIGHAAHAAGIAGLLKLLAAFERDELQPSLHFRRANPMLGLEKTRFHIQTGREPWPRPEGGRRVAGISSFGFSGTNCHLVLADPPARIDDRPSPRGPALITLSAPTATALARRGQDLLAWLRRNPDVRLDDLAFTLAVGRSHFDLRFACIVDAPSTLADLLAAAPTAGELRLAVAVPALEAVARDYLAGEDPDFTGLTPDARRLALPTYPFELSSYWIAAPVAEPVAATATTPLPTLLAPAWEVLAAQPAVAVERPLLIEAAPGQGAAALRPLLERITDLMRAPTKGPQHILYLHDGRPETAAVASLAPSLRFMAAPVSLQTLELPPSARADLDRHLPAILASGEARLRLDAGGRLLRLAWQPHRPVRRRAADLQGGVWLITGGLGALGRRFARHLALTRGAKIGLLGRGPLDGERRQALDQLRRQGVDAAYASADVADPAALAGAVAELERALGPVTAVLHAAGLPGGAVIGAKGWAEMAPVLEVKIDGARALDEVLAAHELRAFVLFSSLAAEHGDFGQCDYALANAALARFAGWRAAEVRAGRRHGRTLSLAWPIWEGGHEALSAEGRELFSRALGMPFLAEAQGIAAFEAGLAEADMVPELLVTTADLPVRPVVSAPAKAVLTEPAPVAATAIGLLPAVSQRLTELIARQQKLDPARLRPEAGLAEFGFDSIGLKELATLIGDSYRIPITPAVFFAHGSITALARHLLAAHGPEVAAAHALAVDSEPKPAAAAPAPQPTAAPAADDQAVAIIGMAGRFPGAADADELWQLVERGGSAVGPMPAERRALLGLASGPALTGGYLDGVEQFDHEPFQISRRDALHMDPQHRLVLQAVWHALEDAAITPTATGGRCIGAFLGQQVNAYAGIVQVDEASRPQLALGNVPALLPGRVSHAFDWHGPSEAIDTACSTGLVAVHRAVRALRDGECEMAVAGAVSLILDPEDIVTTERLGILSPDGRCHSFDSRANGYVKGEGVGVVLLKPLATALADGDPIRAVIRGSAVNHGGRAQSLTAPNSTAQTALIRAALADAAVEPATIGYLEAHGTGTELGDPVEVEGLKAAFGQVPAGGCALGTIKAAIGHLEPAAGIAGLVEAVLALQHRKRPPLAGFEKPNPYLALEGSPFFISRSGDDWPATAGPRRAGVSSFGFGGTNAHLVLEEAPFSSPATADASSVPLLLPLAAADRGQLATWVRTLAAALRRRPVPAADLVLTCMLGRAPLACRAALLVESEGAVLPRLEALLAHLEGAGPLPADAWFGSSERLALVSDDPDDRDYLETLCRRGRLDRLAGLWCAGTTLPWADLLPLLPGMQGARRRSLPGLPFRPLRCWLEPRTMAAPPVVATLPAEPAPVPRPAPLPVPQPVAVAPVPVPPPPPPPSPAATSPERIAVEIRRIVAEALYLAPEDLDANAGFMDLGLDSILAVEVAKTINDRLGTDLQATRLYDHPTVLALAAHLAERLAEGGSGALPAVAAVEEPEESAESRAVLDFLRHELAAALGLEAGDVPADTPLDRLAIVPEAAQRILDALNRRLGTHIGLDRLGTCRDLGAVARLAVDLAGEPPPAVAPAPPAPSEPAPVSDELALLRREMADLLFVPADAIALDLPPAEQGLDMVLASELVDRLAARFPRAALDPRRLLTAASLRALALDLSAGPPTVTAAPVPAGDGSAWSMLEPLIGAARAEGWQGPLQHVAWHAAGAAEALRPRFARQGQATLLLLEDAAGEAAIEARPGRTAFPPPPDLDRALLAALPAHRVESGTALWPLLPPLLGTDALPRRIDRLACYGPLMGELRLWATLRPAAAGDGAGLADILVVQPDGRILAELRGCAFTSRGAAAIAPVAPAARVDGNGHAGDGHRAADQDRVRQVVEAQIRAVLPGLAADAIRPGVALAELGANSIDRAEVAACAMEALDVVVPPGDLAEVADVDGLIALLARHLARPAPVSGQRHAAVV